MVSFIAQPLYTPFTAVTLLQIPLINYWLPAINIANSSKGITIVLKTEHSPVTATGMSDSHTSDN
jgi:hypothetical protein